MTPRRRYSPTGVSATSRDAPPRPADPELSTRFLGDLYQDISPHAKETYALLQTPVFVEEFILDRTLDRRWLSAPRRLPPHRPDLRVRALPARCLRPAARSLERKLPAWNSGARAGALDAVHGVDLNPFAVAIARFRLTLAAMKAAACTTWRTRQRSRSTSPTATRCCTAQGSDVSPRTPTFKSSDTRLKTSPLSAILEAGRYDVVVGNPPYITVKDKALNAEYRRRYATCHRTYALTVPFMERFFNSHAAIANVPAVGSGRSPVTRS